MKKQKVIINLLLRLNRFRTCFKRELWKCCDLDFQDSDPVSIFVKSPISQNVQKRAPYKQRIQRWFSCIWFYWVVPNILLHNQHGQEKGNDNRLYRKTHHLCPLLSDPGSRDLDYLGTVVETNSTLNLSLVQLVRKPISTCVFHASFEVLMLIPACFTLVFLNQFLPFLLFAGFGHYSWETKSNSR